MKVLIVGAGPAGSLSAIELGKRYDVTLVEEHQSAGFPVQCAGLISQDCYKKLRKFSDCKLNEIRGAVFFSPSGKYVELEGKSKAVVIERKILDRDLLAKASENAEVYIKTKFVNAEGNKAKLLRFGEVFTKEYDYLIGADGAYSAVAKTFNFERPRIYSAVQVLCKFEPLSDDMVELYFGFSDFFCYAIPIDDFARIGVISSSNPQPILKRFIRWLSDRVKSSFIELNTGAIPIGLIDFVKDNIMLIGDSAGMVKPYTGGGLFYLLKAVEKLEHFPNLEKIRREYLKELSKEYRVGMRILKLYSTLKAEDYDYLIEVAKEHGHLAKELHMDKPSTLLKVLPILAKIVKKPGILKKLIFAF